MIEESQTSRFSTPRTWHFSSTTVRASLFAAILHVPTAWKIPRNWCKASCRAPDHPPELRWSARARKVLVQTFERALLRASVSAKRKPSRAAVQSRSSENIQNSMNGCTSSFGARSRMCGEVPAFVSILRRFSSMRIWSVRRFWSYPCWYPIRSGVTINGMHTIADRNGSGDCEIEAERRGLLAVIIRSVCACERPFCLAYFEGETAARAHRVRRFWTRWVQEQNRKTESSDRALSEDPLSTRL
jgi:hypothetical protein